MSLPENISSPNVSEPVVRHQPKKSPIPSCPLEVISTNNLVNLL